MSDRHPMTGNEMSGSAEGGMHPHSDCDAAGLPEQSRPVALPGQVGADVA